MELFSRRRWSSFKGTYISLKLTIFNASELLHSWVWNYKLSKIFRTIAELAYKQARYCYLIKYLLLLCWVVANWSACSASALIIRVRILLKFKNFIVKKCLKRTKILSKSPGMKYPKQNIQVKTLALWYHLVPTGHEYV